MNVGRIFWRFLCHFYPFVCDLVHSFVDVFDTKTQFTSHIQDLSAGSVIFRIILKNAVGDGHQLGAGNVRLLGVERAVL